MGQTAGHWLNYSLGAGKGTLLWVTLNSPSSSETDFWRLRTSKTCIQLCKLQVLSSCENKPMHMHPHFNLQKYFKIQALIWQDAECFSLFIRQASEEILNVHTVEAGEQPQMLIYRTKKQSLLQVPCKRAHCLQQNFSEDWGHLSLHRGHSVSPGITLGLYMHESNISRYKHSSPSRPPSLSVLKDEFIENICTTRNMLCFFQTSSPWRLCSNGE